MKAAPIEAHAAVNRLYSLDLLRGICAIMVAAYHFRLWSDLSVTPEIAGYLAYWGLYGVSIFFILSGFSLAYAYDSTFGSEITSEKMVRFVRRRIGRLAPLFIVVLALSATGKFVTTGDAPSISQIASNSTLLFGFYDPSDTPIVGGWSIGIEIVFYLFLPIMMLLRRYWIVLSLAIVVITFEFGEAVSRHDSLVEGWNVYVSPGNHIIFFAFGVFMVGLSRSSTTIGGIRLALGLSLLAIFLFWACSGQPEIDLVTGWLRAVLVGVSVLTVYRFSIWSPPESLTKLCEMMGGLSYSMYLIHPLVFFASSIFLDHSVAAVLCIFGLCIALAIAVDLWVDRPIQLIVKSKGW